MVVHVVHEALKAVLLELGTETVPGKVQRFDRLCGASAQSMVEAAEPLTQPTSPSARSSDI